MKAKPDVTSDDFVNVAQDLWALGEFAPAYALSIRGLAAKWDIALAKLRLKHQLNPRDEDVYVPDPIAQACHRRALGNEQPGDKELLREHGL